MIEDKNAVGKIIGIKYDGRRKLICKTCNKRLKTREQYALCWNKNHTLNYTGYYVVQI